MTVEQQDILQDNFDWDSILKVDADRHCCTPEGGGVQMGGSV